MAAFGLLGFSLQGTILAAFGRLVRRDLSQRRVKMLLEFVSLDLAGEIDEPSRLAGRRDALFSLRS